MHLHTLFSAIANSEHDTLFVHVNADPVWKFDISSLAQTQPSLLVVADALA